MNARFDRRRFMQQTAVLGDGIYTLWHQRGQASLIAALVVVGS
jgi:hypothetical protein